MTLKRNLPKNRNVDSPLYIRPSLNIIQSDTWIWKKEANVDFEIALTEYISNYPYYMTAELFSAKVIEVKDNNPANASKQLNRLQNGDNCNGWIFYCIALELNEFCIEREFTPFDFGTPIGVMAEKSLDAMKTVWESPKDAVRISHLSAVVLNEIEKTDDTVDSIFQVFDDDICQQGFQHMFRLAIMKKHKKEHAFLLFLFGRRPSFSNFAKFLFILSTFFLIGDVSTPSSLLFPELSLEEPSETEQKPSISPLKNLENLLQELPPQNDANDVSPCDDANFPYSLYTYAECFCPNEDDISLTYRDDGAYFDGITVTIPHNAYSDCFIVTMLTGDVAGHLKAPEQEGVSFTDSVFILKIVNARSPFLKDSAALDDVDPQEPISFFLPSIQTQVWRIQESEYDPPVPVLDAPSRNDQDGTYYNAPYLGGFTFEIFKEPLTN